MIFFLYCLIIMNQEYIFWLDDLSILYKNNKYLEFIPLTTMTKIEQLNAITRFAIYFIILILILNKDEIWIIIAVIIIGFTIYLNKMFNIDSQGKFNEHKGVRGSSRIEKFDPKLTNELFNKDANPEYINDVETGRRDINTNSKIEAGYMDFENKIHIGQKYNPPKYKQYKSPPIYTLDQKIDFQKGTCRRPSVNNPFMNPLLIDFNDGNKQVACNSDDKDINEDIIDKFNKNLYRNVDDLFETENSQRQFYTIPDTSIPNQQTEFANWLWKLPETCKSDQAECLRYTDIRQNR